MSNQIEQLVEYFKSSNYIVVLTGAGVSTESGIPDFRSPKSGLWNKYSPEIVEIDYFMRYPEAFYKFLLDGIRDTFNAKPNFTHYFLGKYEKKGKIKSIITQNIDGLHQKGGSEKVLELHGNMRKAICMKCGKKFKTEEIIKYYKEKNEAPKCSCGGIIKPDVVFFGEMLPTDTLNEAFSEAERCDLFISLGSSLVVTPAALLPHRAKETGSKLAIINLQNTPLDRDADIVINEKVSYILKQLDRKLENV